MAGRVLLAELVLALRDNMSGKAKQAANALKEIDKAAQNLGKNATKDAAALKTLTQQLDKAGQEAKQFAAAMGGAQKWGAGFDRQLSKLKLTAAELAELRKSWAGLQNTIKSSNDAVFRRNLVNRWKADSLSAITAVRAAKEKMDAEDLRAIKERVRQEARASAEKARILDRQRRDEERASLQTYRLRAKMARDLERQGQREAATKERQRAREERDVARVREREMREEARRVREEAREKIREARRVEVEQNRADHRQTTERRKLARSIGREVMFLATGGAGVYMAGRVARRAVTSGADLQREQARDYLSGLSAADSARARGTALGLSSQYPSASVKDLHMLVRESANTSIGMKGAEAIAPGLAQALVVLQSLEGKEAAVGTLMKFLRSLDVLGKNVDPNVVKKLLDAAVRASSVMGAEYKPGDMLAFAKYSKSAGGALSDEFLATMVPLLAGDMSPSRLGTALGTASSSVLAGTTSGGGMSKTKLKQQQSWGLRDGKGLVQSQLFAENPHLWAWEFLKPQLQKVGVDTKNEAELNKALNKIFPQTVADVFFKLISQEDTYRKIAEKFRAAPPTDEAAKKLPGKDPYVAFEGMLAQWDRFTAALTGPAIEKAIPVMQGITEALSSMATYLEGNKDIAADLGLIAGGLGALGAALLTLKGVLAGLGLLRFLQTLAPAAPAAPAATAAAPGVAGAIGGVASGLGAAAVGAGAGALLGNGIVQFFGSTIDAYTPKSAEEVAQLKAMLAEKEKELAGVRERTHPSMAGMPNADADRLEAEIAVLKGRISTAAAELQAAGDQAGQAVGQGVANGLAASAPAAVQAAQNLRSQLQSILGAPITVNVGVSTGGGGGGAATGGGGGGSGTEAPSAPARASGGRALAGSLYRVNELGKEYFRPDTNGTIVPGGGSRASTFSPVFNISGGSSEEVVEQVVRHLERLVQQQARSLMGDYGLDTA